eukprot:NODE_353_length_8928_cov_0.455204.p1 type:complete len:516 gc:universal NODE_353_length_8928_cov_0.455204:3188-1641(-)
MLWIIFILFASKPTQNAIKIAVNHVQNSTNLRKRSLYYRENTLNPRINTNNLLHYYTEYTDLSTLNEKHGSIQNMYETIFKVFRFSLLDLVNLEPGCIVNVLYYAAEHLKHKLESVSDNLDESSDVYWDIHDVPFRAILLLQQYDNRLTQNWVYYKLMIELFDAVFSSDRFKETPQLLKDFAMMFFMNRPINKQAQIEAIENLLTDYGHFGLASQHIDKLPDTFKDIFADYHRFHPLNDTVRDWLPTELVNIYFDKFDIKNVIQYGLNDKFDFDKMEKLTKKLIKFSNWPVVFYRYLLDHVDLEEYELFAILCAIQSCQLIDATLGKMIVKLKHHPLELKHVLSFGFQLQFYQTIDLLKSEYIRNINSNPNQEDKFKLYCIYIIKMNQNPIFKDLLKLAHLGIIEFIINNHGCYNVNDCSMQQAYQYAVNIELDTLAFKIKSMFQIEMGHSEFEETLLKCKICYENCENVKLTSCNHGPYCKESMGKLRNKCCPGCRSTEYNTDSALQLLSELVE